MTPLVSVIVPAYNAGHTLARCLDALLAQDLRAIEALVVDDGSTDDTRSLALRYAVKDARVRVFSLPVNGGVSAARNRGLSEAAGAYIGFCDADDWAEPAMYASLAAALERSGAQAAFCAVIKETAAGARAADLPWPGGAFFDAEAIRGDLLPRLISLDYDGEEQPLSGYTPRNLFARAILEDVRFRGDIRYTEDLVFIVQALLAATSATAIPQPLYHYCQNADSATQRYNPFTQESLKLGQAALEALFAAHGMAGAMAPRLAIRARRNVLIAAVNLCLPGNPYGFARRAGAMAALLKAPESIAAFRNTPLRALMLRQPKQALKYALIRLRCALPLTVIYSYFYKAR